MNHHLVYILGGSGDDDGDGDPVPIIGRMTVGGEGNNPFSMKTRWGVKVVSLLATIINRVLDAGIDGLLFLSQKRNKIDKNRTSWTTDRKSIDEYKLERVPKVRTLRIYIRYWWWWW